VQRIVEVFARQLAQGLHTGAQLVVLRDGQVILDRAAGFTDASRRQPVTPDTPFHLYSCSKALTAVCLLQLIEAERLSLDTPIAEVWPAWGCKGKEKATLRHAFLHQAGIPLGGLYRLMLTAWNWPLAARLIAGLPAEFEPGTRCEYHWVNNGYILGEVLRRVTNQRIDRYMREKVFEPLGMSHSYLGLPQREQTRAARLYAGHPAQRVFAHAFNMPLLRGAVIPAASVNSTARDMARFYQMLLDGGQSGTKAILRPETIAWATSPAAQSVDAHGQITDWGYGFHLGGRASLHPQEPYGMGCRSSIRTFGHFGMATSMAWADPAERWAVVFTCNRLLLDRDASRRWQEISDAVWEAA
jgi:CubicO group peptidase (beta-lactamase class C family)